MQLCTFQTIGDDKPCKDKMLGNNKICLSDSFCAYKSTIKDNIQNAEIKNIAVSKEVFKLGIGIPGKGVVTFVTCPFCHAVYNFPKPVEGTHRQKCACGAAFNTFGTATKFITEGDIAK